MGSSTTPEVWAGVECSHVRIGARWADQLRATGHATRIEDLDRLAALGVTALRYPILWGWTDGTPPADGRARTVPDPADDAAWTWADARLERLRTLGIRPVVGLLHHGGGPLPGGYLDDDFVEAFARYAGAVARRYPWVTDFLPINEPLTNARFAGAYGVWHPHRRDLATFGRLLVRQCLAIRAAIRAIREVTPEARLLANDDLGRAFGTPEVADPVDFMNRRRWATFDLLTGRVDPWLRVLLAADRATAHAVDDLAADPVPPDLIGLDHYVVSDRFVDHRLERYPPHLHGHDGRQPYVDVELVRIRDELLAEAGATIEPFGRALRETWERYRIPLVLAEVHLGGAVTDQVAWWRTGWGAALEARAHGIDVRAVGAWAAFGASDWASLLQREDGLYEPGAFDVRTTPPALTALGEAIRASATGSEGSRDPLAFDPQALGGWWTSPARGLWPEAWHPRQESNLRPSA